MNDTVLSSKYNVYGAITEKIARAIWSQKGKFVMPWHSGTATLDVPTNAATANVYRGVNILSLWIDALSKGFGSGYWASYKQWQSLGAQVRYGERGSLIIFYKKLEATELEAEAGELSRYVGRASWIFNSCQVDNWTPPEPRRSSPVQIDETVAAFVDATEAKVLHGYHKARYRHDLDCIEMPSPAWFWDTPTSTAVQSYHAVLFHELTHWTGPSHRCDRELGKRFGDHAYAFEELVAELGAAFLCAAFKIANEPRPDHAAYVASWLDVLGNDPKAIFTAANKAQEAIEYLGALAASTFEIFEERKIVHLLHAAAKRASGIVLRRQPVPLWRKTKRLPPGQHGPQPPSNRRAVLGHVWSVAVVREACPPDAPTRQQLREPSFRGEGSFFHKIAAQSRSGLLAKSTRDSRGVPNYCAEQWILSRATLAAA